MANSDNVLNAGFEEIDQATLDVFNDNVHIPVNKDPQDYYVKTKRFGRGTQHSTMYDTPFSEFNIVRTVLSTSEKESCGPIEGPSVAVVASGKGQLTVEGRTTDVKQGQVLFIIAGKAVEWSSSEGLDIYRCYAE